MSLDGFIARRDSDLDWLTSPPAGIQHEQISSDHCALEWDTFLPSVDHIVMGRGTYEKALTFEKWPYPEHDVIVLSTSVEANTDPRIIVTRSAASTASLLSEREASSVYIDGGKTVQAFLRQDLIDELTVAIAPVLIGEGIALFGPLPGDIRLRLRAAHAGSGGMTHATYDVVRPEGMRDT